MHRPLKSCGQRPSNKALQVPQAAEEDAVEVPEALLEESGASIHVRKDSCTIDVPKCSTS